MTPAMCVPTPESSSCVLNALHTWCTFRLRCGVTPDPNTATPTLDAALMVAQVRGDMHARTRPKPGGASLPGTRST